MRGRKSLGRAGGKGTKLQERYEIFESIRELNTKRCLISALIIKDLVLQRCSVKPLIGRGWQRIAPPSPSSTEQVAQPIQENATSHGKDFDAVLFVSGVWLLEPNNFIQVPVSPGHRNSHDVHEESFQLVQVLRWQTWSTGVKGNTPTKQTPAG